MKTISYTDALTCIDRYNRQAASFDQVVKGMAINDDAYEAMKAIELQVQGLAGYRVYYGIDTKNLPIFIVVGVKADGYNNENICYSTTPGGSGLCPPICDDRNPDT